MKCTPLRLACSAALALVLVWPGARCIGASPPVGTPEQSISAGPLQVTLKMNRATLNAADNLIATLTVTAPAGVRVTMPPEEKALGGFSVISIVDEPLRTVPIGTGEQQEFVRRYTLEPYLPGEYTLPPLEIRWTKGANQSGAARTSPVNIIVESLLPPPSGSDSKAPDAGTIRGLYTAPVEHGTGSLWAGVAIGFVSALAVGGGVWIAKRRSRAPDEVKRLLERVEALRDSKGTDALHELALSIRGAMAARFGPGLASADTGEVVMTLASRAGWGDVDAGGAGALLGTLDAARFSGAGLPATEFHGCVESTLAILKKLHEMPAEGKR